jgi:multiple sugar transport system substrate-binding protein
MMWFAVIGTGCERSSPRGDGIQLVYWSSTNPDEIALAERLTDEWNTAHPDTQVVLQPLPEGRSGEEVLIIAAAGNTTPDICSNLPPVIVPLLAKAGSLVPIDRFESGRATMEQRLPDGSLRDYLHSDDSLYQVPWKGNPIMVQYNLGVLRDAGVTKLPRTWSEWNEAAEKVTRDLNGDGHDDVWMADIQIESEWRRRLFDFYVFYIAATEGRTLLDHGKVDFERDRAQEVLEFFAEGYENGWYPHSILVGDMFLQNRFAAHVTGPWNIAHTERLKPDGFEYDFGPIPIPDDMDTSRYTFGDPKSIGIFSSTKHPEAAWRFVRFLTSRHADLLLLEQANQLPLRRDLLSDTLYADYFNSHPRMRVFATRVPYAVGFDQHPALQEVFDAVNTAFDAAAIHGIKTPGQALKEAAEHSRHILSVRGG